MRILVLGLLCGTAFAQAEDAQAWARRRLGEVAQPCQTEPCRHNPDAWAPKECARPRHLGVESGNHLDWFGYGARLVRAAYGQPPTGESASDFFARAALRKAEPVPPGALVFWHPGDPRRVQVGMCIGGDKVLFPGERGIDLVARRRLLRRGSTWGWCDAAGLGWTKRASDPVYRVRGMARATAGDRHVLAIDDAGYVWGWGANDAGELGLTGRRLQAFPVRVPGLREIVAVACARGRSYALQKDSALWTWGHGAQPRPVRMPELAQAQTVVAGLRHTLAIDMDGHVFAWGSGLHGQLGEQLVRRSERPLRVPGAPVARAVAAGAFHSVVLDETGRVWTWGGNRHGQLGREGDALPNVVARPRDVRAIAAGGSHTVALTQDGRVWTWGYNWKGQLGFTGRARRVPFQVPDLPAMVQVAAGTNHTVALAQDGTVWFWGGASGAAPLPVEGLGEIATITAGSGLTLAIGSDGRAWAWGRAFIGRPDQTSSKQPVPIWGFEQSRATAPPPPPATVGAFVWPISGEITQATGPGHKGTDISSGKHEERADPNRLPEWSAPKAGADVYAAAAGTVTVHGVHRLAGRYVVIHHGRNLKTRYLHLFRVLVTPGENVTPETRIGIEGNTGLVKGGTGTHLHLVLFRDDNGNDFPDAGEWYAQTPKLETPGVERGTRIPGWKLD